jgi:hypothetical protein
MLETSSIIADQNCSILIELGDIGIFIYSEVLKRIKVNEVEQDEFRYVEMTSGSKQKVGRNVMGLM